MVFSFSVLLCYFSRAERAVCACVCLCVFNILFLRYLSLFSSVQSLSCVRLFATPWIAALQVSLSITNSWSLLKLMPIELVMPSSHLILCRPLLLLPSIPPSIRVFSNESTLRMRWSKYWRFSFSISPSNEHPGLISFRMGWLDLPAVRGTLKSLLQHHSSKTSILWPSAFFTVQSKYSFTSWDLRMICWITILFWVYVPSLRNDSDNLLHLLKTLVKKKNP